MTRSSRLLLPFALVVLAASLAAGVPRAAAIDPFPTGPSTLSSDHFQVHLSGDTSPCPTATITQEHAGDLLGMAERAYALYSSWGYTTPVPDSGDGLTDISVDDFVTGCLTFGSIDISVPVPLEPLGRDHHSRRPRRRGRDPSQRRDGAQLPHRRARGLSPLRGCRCFRPTPTSGCTKGSPNGQRFAPRARSAASSRIPAERWIASVPRAATASSIATATPGGCSSSISPSVSATAPSSRSSTHPPPPRPSRERKPSPPSSSHSARRSGSSSRTTRPPA